MLLRRIADRAARTAYGREAIRSKADLGIFKAPPSPALVIGLVLLGLSYVIGWPGVIASGVAAAYLKKPLVFIIGGPAVYAFSFLVWGVSMLLIGKDNIKYMRALGRYGTRVFIERFAGPSYREKSPSVPESGSPSSNFRDRE